MILDVHAELLSMSLQHTVAEEVELRVRVLLLATSVLAIDNMRLVGVDCEAARRESIGERRQDGLRLRFRFAVYQPIIGVPTPRHARKRPCHPGVERVMQKEIGQEGTDDAAL